MRLRAVIFDCDGVLADTEPLHLRAYNTILEPLGVAIGPAEYAADFLGLDDREAFARVLALRGVAHVSSDVERLVEAKARTFTEVLRAECRIYPGVRPFVRSFDGLARAVASGARREEIAIVLEHAGLANAFPVVVGMEDVAVGKPDPAPFLRALGELNRAHRHIEPDQCLVVEDSRLGIVAARRAGMRCLAVTTSYPAAALTDADLVAESLENVRLPEVHGLVA